MARILPFVRRPRVRRTAAGFSALVPTAQGVVRSESPDADTLVADLFAFVDAEAERIGALLEALRASRSADAPDLAAARTILNGVVLCEEDVLDVLYALRDPAVDDALDAACAARNAEDAALGIV